MPRLPRLPRPKLRRRKQQPPPEYPPPSPDPGPPNDLWFRFVTRLRAVFYWIQEKAKVVWGAVRSASASALKFWRSRSDETRTRALLAAAVVVLYLLIRFAPVPGVPCQIAASRECAPSDDAIAYVPENALFYGHLTIDRDSHQSELAGDLGEDLPDVTQLAGQAGAAIPTLAGQPVDIRRDILPWAEQDLALTLLPGPGDTSLPVAIAGVDDREAAERFLATVAPGQPKNTEHEGTDLLVYPGGFAAAFAGDQLIFGIESAVRVALDAEAGRAPALEGSDQDAAREELPGVRFAEVYFSRPGVQQLLAGTGAGASQLDTFVDYGATSGMAASVRIRDDGVEVNLVSKLDQKRLSQSPTVFSELPPFEPELADEAGSRALAYIGVGEIGPTLTNLLASAGQSAQGLAGSLRALARRLQQQAGIDPLQDLLPALGGQAAVVAEPTDGVPFASLIVDGVDEGKADEALARLQGPLVRALGTQGGAQVPRFKESEEDGVTVHSVQVSATINLSYAVFDGKLVVSTDPAGIAQVRADADDLAGTDSFERVKDGLPDDSSALVFLNLDELQGLAEQAGLAEDPLYASLSDDIGNIPALGLAVTGSDEQIHSEMFLELDD